MASKEYFAFLCNRITINLNLQYQKYRGKKLYRLYGDSERTFLDFRPEFHVSCKLQVVGFLCPLLTVAGLEQDGHTTL